MGLTRKEKEFVKQVVTNKTATNAEIIRNAGYLPKDNSVASAMYSNMMRNDRIKSALSAYTELAENTIIKSIKDYGNSDRQWQRTLAVETSKWVHDKVHGKAAQMNFNVNQDFTEFSGEQNKKYNI